MYVKALLRTRNLANMVLTLKSWSIASVLIQCALLSLSVEPKGTTVSEHMRYVPCTGGVAVLTISLRAISLSFWINISLIKKSLEARNPELRTSSSDYRRTGWIDRIFLLKIPATRVKKEVIHSKWKTMIHVLIRLTLHMTHVWKLSEGELITPWVHTLTKKVQYTSETNYVHKFGVCLIWLKNYLYVK